MQQTIISETTYRRSDLLRLLGRMNIDISTCRICKCQDKRMNVHHIDGNHLNNKLNNLAIVCTFCHFAIHDNISKREGKSYEEIYGIERANEIKNKMVENHVGMSGKKWNKEQKINMSKKIKKVWEDEYFRKNHKKGGFPKGKSYDEYYGKKRADRIREKMSENSPIGKIRKGKTLEEIYGIERAKSIKEKISLNQWKRKK